MQDLNKFQKFKELWSDLMPQIAEYDLVKFHILDFLETISQVHGYHERFTPELLPYYKAFTQKFYFANENEILTKTVEFIEKTTGKFYIEHSKKTG